MRLVQRCSLPADRERLWELLMDVPRVARCVPGVEAVEPLDATRYRGTVKVQIGPVRLALEGTITIEERDRDAWRAAMRAEAADRRAGGGLRARMTMSLAPAAEGTDLLVETDLSILGKIGEFGQPVIKRKADALMQDFAANLRASLQGP